MPNGGAMICPGMMCMLLWGLLGIGLLALLVIGIAWGVRRLKQKGSGAPSKQAKEILNERYAKGEINKEEYEKRKRDLAA